jgi:hypothetical protein
MFTSACPARGKQWRHSYVVIASRLQLTEKYAGSEKKMGSGVKHAAD